MTSRTAVAAALIAGHLVAQAGVAVAAKRILVQKRFAEMTSGTTISVGLRKTTATGHLIVAYVVWDNPGGATVADSAGNTWANAVGPTRPADDPTTAQIFYARNIAGALTTVTVTFAAPITSHAVLFVHEYAGLDPTAPLGSAIASTGTSTATDPGFLTTVTPNTALFLGVASNGLIAKRPRGFHRRGRTRGTMTADTVPKAPGTFDAPGTQTGTAWVAQMVAL